MAGRKTKCTSEITEEIVKSIESGLTNRDAALMAGVSENAYYKWMARGKKELERLAKSNRTKERDEEEPFIQFLQSIKKAQAKRKQKWVNTIDAASNKQWQAAAWLLERCHPEEFAQKILIERQVRKELESALDLLSEALEYDEYAKVIGVLAGQHSET